MNGSQIISQFTDALWEASSCDLNGSCLTLSSIFISHIINVV